MRLDHYFKIGNNNIHLAQIIYSIVTTSSFGSYPDSVSKKEFKHRLQQH
jgi:hypothetical protein